MKGSSRRPEQVAETLRQVIADALTRGEVREGLECGIGIENFNDLKVGDRIESYRMVEVKRTLSASAAGGAAAS